MIILQNWCVGDSVWEDVPVIMLQNWCVGDSVWEDVSSDYVAELVRRRQCLGSAGCSGDYLADCRTEYSKNCRRVVNGD